ncbi:MAG: SPASM domain-containing protein [Lentimicrobiaceae bacterium]|jgi:uncharacterized protein|nr:SPASM domain-containing protein [Lentimicrobiaceae bacterium]
MNVGLISKFIIGTDPYLHPECKECSILPICWGGCPMDRFNNKFNRQNIDTCCRYKGKMEKFVLKYINKS